MKPAGFSKIVTSSPNVSGSTGLAIAKAVNAAKMKHRTIIERILILYLSLVNVA